MKQKSLIENGFTLIELLAVIVILAVIALIATPLVLNIIERAEKGAFRDSVYGIMEAAEFQVILDGSKYPITFVYPLDSDRIKFKGTKPSEGYLQIVSEGKMKLALGNGRWCAVKDVNESQVTITDGKCEKIDLNLPIISGYGDLKQEVNLNANYELPNVTAVDKDGNKLNVTTVIKLGDKEVNTIDTSKEGSYTIIYTTEADKEGNITTVNVTVVVVNKEMNTDQIIQEGLKDGGLELIGDTYYYRGSNPDNYITFDNSSWRIISIENGSMKLIKSEGFTTAWDTSGSYGSNNWERPSIVKTYLNTDFYNTISSTNKEKIREANWNIGTVILNTGANASTIKENEKSRTWTGKIGLMNASDYVYASPSTNCTNQAIQNVECKTDNWLYDSNNWYWTINASSAYPCDIFLADLDGSLNVDNAKYTYHSNIGIARPVIYLKEDTKIVSGEGTSTSPFMLSN